jgi:hypothetical protein
MVEDVRPRRRSPRRVYRRNRLILAALRYEFALIEIAAGRRVSEVGTITVAARL